MYVGLGVNEGKDVFVHAAHSISPSLCLMTTVCLLGLLRRYLLLEISDYSSFPEADLGTSSGGSMEFWV